MNLTKKITSWLNYLFNEYIKLVKAGLILWYVFLPLLIIVLSLYFLLSCDSQEAKNDANSSSQNTITKESSNEHLIGTPYEGWLTFSGENVNILYPPGHPNENDLPNIARQYSIAINTVTERLKMPPYIDTLLFIYYSGYGQGREMTGQEYPFGTDTAIHFWLPSFPGPTLMQHLLPRWVAKEPQFQFLKHGLISMFDFSGQPYHESTIGYYNQGKFMGADELAADTTVNSNTERYQSAMSASFVAFIMGAAGIDGLRIMYMSEIPFDETVEKLFNMPVDSLNKQWLKYIKQTVPKDSIIDSLWK